MDKPQTEGTALSRIREAREFLRGRSFPATLQQLFADHKGNPDPALDLLKALVSSGRLDGQHTLPQAFKYLATYGARTE